MTGTKHLREYIDRRQAKVAEWVALRQIFEVCAKETGYEGGVRERGQCWRQKAAEGQLNTTLKEISEAPWERWRRESVMRGEGKEESDSGGDV